MRKVIVLLSAVLLISVVATAATTNPEGFEGYALTNDWQPTLAVEGWHLEQMYGVDGGVASLVDDGGDQVLDIVSAAAPGGGAMYGMVGHPGWDADGPADADVAVTKSGFDFKPIGGANGSEFHAKLTRADAAVEWYQATWEVGVRVSLWGDFSTPYSPYTLQPEFGCWVSTGTYVYLRTWTDSGAYTETEIPGFGEGVHIVPGILAGTECGNGANPGIDPEWYTMEIEEDNATQETRARMYLRGSSPGAEDGWTAWVEHNAAADYSTGGQVSAFLGGQMQFDNFYITGEGGGDVCNPGDANNDLLVSADDYASVQGAFGNTGTIGIPGDANCDGLVSADDYASVQSNFGTTYGGAPIPEPTTIGLLAMGMIAIIRKRK
jgi:hypothetical protein